MYKICKLIIVCLFCFVTSSYATLDLELTQGVEKAIPIALVKFSGPDSVISEVINNDLQNSGRFRVTLADSQQDAKYWSKQKINNIITGEVKTVGFKYRVSFKLRDNNKTLLDKQYTIKKSNVRALAHHISDVIYQQLVGVPGVFSTKIAYVLVKQAAKGANSYSLMVADADGYNPNSLLNSSEPIMSPAWAPNGKELAYVSFENERSAIYIQNISTGRRRIVAKYAGVDGAPAWSPDGKKLALVLTITANPKIYILDIATSKILQLTRGDSLDTEPNWAPDGKSVIFTSNRSGGPQIYRVDIETGKVERITFQNNYNARASFTPDGKKIVMMTRGKNNIFNIATLDLATSEVALLTEFGVMNKSPSIAPNGSMVVYATNYGRRGVLAEVSVDGKVQLRLPAQEGDVQEPAWSPYLYE